MSLFRHFYIESGESFPVKLCDCKGGDGGAGARADAALAKQAAEDKRIRGNISLIDLLFANDPNANAAELEELQAELAAFGDPPTQPILPDSPFGAIADQQGKTFSPIVDPNAARRGEIDSRILLLNDAAGLLTGPTKTQREASVVGDVENFFFDDLTEQKEISSREGKFELRRRGGTRGSQELDFIRETQRKEDDALLDIGTVAQSALDNLRLQDSVLEANLIDQANLDIDRNIITGDFVNNLGAGLSSATNTAQLTQFDPFFENAGNLFKDVALARGGASGRRAADDNLLSFFAGDPKRSFGTVRT